MDSHMKDKTSTNSYKVQVVANIHDIDLNQYFIEVEYTSVEGEQKRCMLPRSIMNAGSKAFEKLLDLGADLPSKHGAGTTLIRDLLNRAPRRTLRITSRTGWHGQSFVLRDVTIGPD